MWAEVRMKNSTILRKPKNRFDYYYYLCEKAFPKNFTQFNEFFNTYKARSV